jgi:hypothetical protein
MPPDDDLKTSESFSPEPGASPEATPPPQSPEPSGTGETPTTETTKVQPAEAKETLLDAVLKVTKATDEKAKPDGSEPQSGKPEPQGSKDGEKADKQADEAEDDASEEDDEKAAQEANPVTRKKINKLLRQRRELRNEVEQLRPVARIGNELETFSRTNDLSGDDVILCLQMAAAIRRGDYEEFYRTVSPYVRKAQEYIGVVLPPDLHQRVEQGHMTVEAAKEFARTRFDNERSRAAALDAQDRQAQSSVAAMQSDIQRSVSALEARFAASDPDYKAKADQVRRVAQAMLFERGGRITSVNDALQITKDAYVEVSKSLRARQPPPRPTAPVPNGHGQSPSARQAPRTLMEAAQQALENARR